MFLSNHTHTHLYTYIACRDLSNTKWTLLYTSTEGQSSGKIGPVVGRVIQEFESNGEIYYNKLSLFNDNFLIALKARATREGSPSQIRVVFLDTTVSLNLFG